MQDSLGHCLNFVLLHPPVLCFIYNLIGMQQFCHQKFNLPHKNSVPLFHHPTHISCHTAVHCPHPFHKAGILFAPPFSLNVLQWLKIWKKKKRNWGKEHERVKYLTLINVTVFLWLCSTISNTLLPTPMFLNLMKCLILWTCFPKCTSIYHTDFYIFNKF